MILSTGVTNLMITSLEVGTRIKVEPKHWLRGNSIGSVVELLDNGRFMVEFDTKGKGFDGGIHLVLAEMDVIVLKVDP